jgi:hypothetical protein
MALTLFKVLGFTQTNSIATSSPKPPTYRRPIVPPASQCKRTSSSANSSAPAQRHRLRKASSECLVFIVVDKKKSVDMWVDKAVRTGGVADPFIMKSNGAELWHVHL